MHVLFHARSWIATVSTDERFVKEAGTKILTTVNAKRVIILKDLKSSFKNQLTSGKQLMRGI